MEQYGSDLGGGPGFLGANVYLWGMAAQNRFLVGCLGPAIREMHGEGVASGFWFDRFDARGPHIFFLTRPTRDFAAVRARLAGQLETFLARSPSTEDLSFEKLDQRHQQVAHKALCVADKLPGFAENNTFLFFPQDPGDYPFRVAAHLPEAAAFWRLLGDLALWTIRQLEASPEQIPAAAGIRWAASLDAALRKAAVAQDYWRYHATTLLPGLAERTAERDRQTIASLIEVGSARNREIFSRLWQEVESSGPPWPQISHLVEVALSGTQSDQRFAALREATHCTLKQLGLLVSQHVPLVLFAWGKSLEP